MGEKVNTVTVRGVLVGEDTPSDVVIEKGKVVSVRSAGRGGVDAGSRQSIISPTLFDVHVNGVGGIDLHKDGLKPEDVAAVSEWLAKSGVSHWIPTLTTRSLNKMERGCRVLAEALQDKTIARAVPGIHLEGPCISRADGPRGAHPKRHVRKPSIREFDRLMKAADGRVLYTTIAPELEGAVPYIRAVVRRGVIVSLGHHQATADDIAKAVDAGARLCTHLGNGCAAVLDRHHNPLWPQLAEDRLSASFIADLEHLPPAALKTFLRAKGPDRAILTSDCVYLAGLKPGRYRMANAQVELTPAGRINLVGTSLLAGSALMLLQGVINTVQVMDMTLAQAVAGATAIPARFFGLRHRFIPARVGKRADIIVFDIDKSKSRWKPVIRGVFVNGDRKG